MSHYKIIDSTLSVLYCARCANEDLEIIAPGRILCRDCGMDVTLDPNLVRVGQLKGTKYKMRDKQRYTFREIVDTARQDAFKEKYVPSPDPGKGRVGWRHEAEPEAEAAAQEAAAQVLEERPIKIVGADEHPGKGWRQEAVVDMITAETVVEEDDDDTGNGSVCRV